MPTVKRGPVLEQKIKAEEETFDNWKSRTCIVGPSGSGKTQVIETFPLSYRGKSGKALIISYDGRYQTLIGCKDFEIINLFDRDPQSPSAWLKARDLRKELWHLARKGNFPYALIVEDNMTLMGRYAMNWALKLHDKTGLGGAPAEHHYMPQMKAFADHVLSMKELPCHYILTGHYEIVENQDEGILQYLPKVIGKTSRTELATWFDETYWAYRKKDKEGVLRYYWTTKGDGKLNFFKSTLNKKGKFWEDPVVIDLEKNPAGFRYILEKRFGRLEK